MCTDHANSTQYCQQLCLFFFSLFFPHFLAIFTLLTIFDMCTDHVNSTPTLSTTVYIMSILCFLFFPHFLAIFTLIITFRNACRPCKQLSNITMPFLFFFLISFLFFQLKMQKFPYLEFFISIPVTGFQCHSSDWTLGTIPV